MSKHRGRDPIAVVSVDRPRNLYAREAIASPKAGTRGRRATGLSLAILLTGVIAGGMYCLQSGVFRVRHVLVNGGSVLLNTAVADLIVPGCGGVLPDEFDCDDAALGPNQLTLSPSDLEREIEGLPAVKKASVHVRLPDHLEVTIEERQPAIAWLVGSDTLRVADDGTVIDRGPVDGLKLSIGQVAGTPLKPGDKVDPVMLQAAQELQARLPSEFGVAAKRVQFSPTDGLAVVGDGEMIAMFGAPSDLNLKMAELQRIVQSAADKKTPIAFVDLRYKTPYYRTR